MHQWRAGETKKGTQRCNGPNVLKEDVYHDSPLQNTNAHDRRPWARYSHGTSAYPLVPDLRTDHRQQMQSRFRARRIRKGEFMTLSLYLRSWGGARYDRSSRVRRPAIAAAAGLGRLLPHPAWPPGGRGHHLGFWSPRCGALLIVGCLTAPRRVTWALSVSGARHRRRDFRSRSSSREGVSLCGALATGRPATQSCCIRDR